MNSKPKITIVFISLIMILALASCNLPTITPPPAYAPTEAPTTNEFSAPTAVPPTAAPVLQAVVISSANAGSLAAVKKAPATNVQALDWSSDSSTLGVISQNQDSSGNSTSSASLLNGSNLDVKTVWLAPDSGQIAQISPDGHIAAVITKDMMTVNLYDLADGDKNIVSLTPQYTIGGVTFSPDGKFFTVTNYDSMEVSVFSLADVSNPTVLKGFTTAAPVFNVGFAGNATDLVWHARATLQLQNIASGTLGPTFNHEDFVSDYQLSTDGKILASAAPKTIDGNPESAVTLWDTASGSELRTLKLTQQATRVSFSPDGTLLAVATGNDVQVWNVASGTQIATLTGHSDMVYQVAFSPDGKSLASSGQDNQLILWQVLQ